jgi:hypothetical protein
VWSEPSSRCTATEHVKSEKMGDAHVRGAVCSSVWVRSAWCVEAVSEQFSRNDIRQYVCYGTCPIRCVVAIHAFAFARPYGLIIFRRCALSRFLISRRCASRFHARRPALRRCALATCEFRCETSPVFHGDDRREQGP